MGRKDILKYNIIATQSGATTFDTKSNPTCVDYLDNMSFQVYWTGSLVGALKIWVSNDKVDPKLGQSVTNWSQYEPATTLTIDGTHTDMLINIALIDFSFVALEYVATSGTGNITANLTGRMIGG
jgi:hypothetical protein